MALEPRCTAPLTDPSYGITGAGKDASWPGTEEKLTASRNYWVCTTRANGAPHSKPVWGVWEDGLWFSTGTKAVSGRNLARDPRISVHLESGDDTVILEGTVEGFVLAQVPASVTVAYAEKYGFDPTAENSGETDAAGLWYRLVPTVALTWQEADFPNTAARWEFD